MSVSLHLAPALLVHAAVFGLGVWLWRGLPVEPAGWWLCYAAGAGFLLAGRWSSRCRLAPRTAMLVVVYAVLLALLFWGAEAGLEALGNSVRARRLPAEGRPALPFHLVWVPGVASVGLAALLGSLAGPGPAGRRRP